MSRPASPVSTGEPQQPAHGALSALDRLPRQRLSVEPTPLVRMHALESEMANTLGRAVPRILVKLDSYTGFAMGGNKVRKLEYVLAPERLEGVTHLITAGGLQSNHARVTAAAAARLGLSCVLVLNGEAAGETRGNARLQAMFGADVRTVLNREDRGPAMERLADDIAASGGHPMIIPLGASTPLGAVGYARAGREFHLQMDGSVSGGAGTTVVIACSSCGTLAGLHLAFSLIGNPDVRLLGISADANRDEIIELTRSLAEGAGLHLGWSGQLAADRLDVSDEFIGGGYGIPTVESDRASDLFGRHAGVVLDSTYSAKAAAGFLHQIRTGQIPADETAVFWHTGGWPTALI